MEELDKVVNKFYKGLDLTKAIAKTRLKYNQLQKENKQLKDKIINIEKYIDEANYQISSTGGYYHRAKDHIISKEILKILNGIGEIER